MYSYGSNRFSLKRAAGVVISPQRSALARRQSVVRDGLPVALWRLGTTGVPQSSNRRHYILQLRSDG